MSDSENPELHNHEAPRQNQEDADSGSESQSQYEYGSESADSLVPRAPKAPKKGKESKQQDNSEGLIGEAIRTLILGFVLCIFLKGTVAEARFIPSGSMKPTLMIDDRILVQKVTRYIGDGFKRGDIVVFYPPSVETEVYEDSILGRFIPFFPENPPAFVKRVIGLPGDQIIIRRGAGVYVNGELLDEPYVKEPANYDRYNLESISGVNARGNFIRPYQGNAAPIVVPEGKLFVLGDNRNASADSHVWGFADQSRVVGKVC
ncbi:MAG TPA: signal peptidase I, partial [Candidatus Melainabacteria bacterium]|nr:signal peptidase I [Candidatus Melainabacteria bacterium]